MHENFFNTVEPLYVELGSLQFTSILISNHFIPAMLFLSFNYWLSWTHTTFFLVSLSRVQLYSVQNTFPNIAKASASSNFLFPCLATCSACSKHLKACASSSDFIRTLPIENRQRYSVSFKPCSLQNKAKQKICLQTTVGK